MRLKKIQRRHRNNLSKEEKKELTKEQKLDSLIKKLNQDFGAGTIITKDNMPHVEVVRSRIYSLDAALGGGVAKGRIIEIAGNESSGKTTYALHLIAEEQRNGGTAAFVDAEHALDFSYARKLDVDTDNLLITQPDSGEDALSIVEAMCESGIINMIVIDSVAALVPRAEIEGEMGDSHMGLQARLMSQAMRKLTAVAHKSKTTLIFINQFRSKIGLYGGGKVTTGGNALKFYATQRVELWRPNKPIEKNGEPIGIQVEANVIKNKIAPPFQKASLFVRWGQGFDRYIDILRTAVEQGVVAKGGGGWHTYGDLRIQGEDKMAEAIKEKNLYEELVEKLK